MLEDAIAEAFDNGLPITINNRHLVMHRQVGWDARLDIQDLRTGRHTRLRFDEDGPHYAAEVFLAWYQAPQRVRMQAETLQRIADDAAAEGRGRDCHRALTELRELLGF